MGQSSVQDSLLRLFGEETEELDDRISALVAVDENPQRTIGYDSLLRLYTVAESLPQASVSRKGKMLIAYGKGNALFHLNRNAEALAYLKKSLELDPLLRDTIQLLITYGSIAETQFRLGQYDEQVRAISDGLTVAQAMKSERYISAFRSNLGVAYTKQGDFASAREVINETLAVHEKLNDTLNQAIALNNIGTTYAKEDDDIAALQFHRQAYHLIRDTEHHEIAVGTALNIGSSLKFLGDTVMARQWFEEAIEKARNKRLLLQEARGLLQLAIIIRESKIDSAFEVLQQAEVINDTLGNTELYQETLQSRYLLLHEKGDYKRALDAFQRWRNSTDSLANSESLRGVYKTEAKFIYEQQRLADEEKMRLETKRYERNLWIMMAGFLLLLLGLIFRLKTKRGSSIFSRKAQERSTRGDHPAIASASKSTQEQRTGLQPSVSNSPDNRPHKAPHLGRKQNEMVALLDRAKVHSFLGKPLSESAWKILLVLYDQPDLTNQEIADQVFLSLEGVSSSLRRMYHTFGLRSENRRNLKAALLEKVQQISEDESLI